MILELVVVLFVVVAFLVSFCRFVGKLKHEKARETDSLNRESSNDDYDQNGFTGIYVIGGGSHMIQIGHDVNPPPPYSEFVLDPPAYEEAVKTKQSPVATPTTSTRPDVIIV